MLVPVDIIGADGIQSHSNSCHFPNMENWHEKCRNTEERRNVKVQ